MQSKHLEINISMMLLNVIICYASLTQCGELYNFAKHSEEDLASGTDVEVDAGVDKH